MNAAEKNGESARSGNGRTSIYGGNFNAAADPIAARKKEAQAQAWKVVSNAWKTDKAIDDSIQARRDHYKEMEKIGLAAPQVTYILHALKDRGFDVDVNATTTGEAVETVLGALGRKGTYNMKR